MLKWFFALKIMLLGKLIKHHMKSSDAKASKCHLKNFLL